MNKKALFERNLELSAEFSRYLLENPNFAERIPEDAVVVIMPEYDKEMAEENRKIYETELAGGQTMVLVRVEKLAPPRKSRLVKPRLELVSNG